MSTTFDLEKILQWASEGSNSESKNYASERTIQRHDSEWIDIKVINVSDSNALKRSILEGQELENRYRNYTGEVFENKDLINIRVAGKNIEHGKIRFNDAIVGLNAFYALIKCAAEMAFEAKGKRKLKQNYLDDVYMTAPGSGSFIYKAEVQLFGDDDYQSYPANRSVNLELAKTINSLFECLSSVNDYNISSLLRSDINSSLCKHFVELFSDSSDKVEFDFSWANIGDDVPEKYSKKICFNKKHMNKAIHYQNKLQDVELIKLEKLPACIEKYTWLASKDFGEISLKVKIRDKNHVCTISVDNDDYMKLKKLPPKSTILITADFVLKKLGSSTVYINKVYKIHDKIQKDLF